MRNRLLFDELRGVPHKMKVKLVRQFSELCRMGMLSHDELDLRHLGLQVTTLERFCLAISLLMK